VETSNATVILSFKDETRRAREAWQETINQAEYVRERAKLLAHDMEAVITSAKRIAGDFSTLKGDLKLHHECRLFFLKFLRGRRNGFRWSPSVWPVPWNRV
jgi:hypothetical protein